MPRSVGRCFHGWKCAKFRSDSVQCQVNRRVGCMFVCSRDVQAKVRKYPEAVGVSRAASGHLIFVQIERI